jgi:predicted CXXCH cytochrome family protein
MKKKGSVLLLLMVISLLIGCSPKSSYKVLAIFFDGVVDSTQVVANTQDTVRRDSTGIKVAQDDLGPQYIQHEPYLKQECDKCHDKSSRSSLLQAQPGLCYTCHTDFAKKFSYVHGPVASGYCTDCHAPHLSEIPKLLKRKGQALCLTCHVKDEVIKNIVHKEIGEGDCTKCHDPHGGLNRFILK